VVLPLENRALRAWRIAWQGKGSASPRHVNFTIAARSGHFTQLYTTNSTPSYFSSLSQSRVASQTRQRLFFMYLC
jgi:hypothetical protein